MNVAIQNRDAVYYHIIDALPEKRALVFQVIKEIEPCSNKDIANYLSIPINEVTPRVSELKNEYLIYEAGKVSQKNSPHKLTTVSVLSREKRNQILDKEYQRLVDEISSLERDALKCDSALSLSIFKKEIQKRKTQIGRLGNISDLELEQGQIISFKKGRKTSHIKVLFDQQEITVDLQIKEKPKHLNTGDRVEVLFRKTNVFRNKRKFESYRLKAINKIV